MSFHTQELRDCCASLEAAEALIGFEHARELVLVLSDAEAAETVAEFIELYTPVAVVDGLSISLPIGTEYHLLFVALGVIAIDDRDATLNWRTVRRLKLMEIAKC